MTGFLHDLRFGLRQVVKRPGFALAAILTLALGIGANTAVFSVLNGYLLKPLPYPHSDRLVVVGDVFRKIGDNIGNISIPNYLSVTHNTAAFSAAGLFDTSSFGLQTGDRALEVRGAYVTPSLFKVLGAKPLLGHVFGKDATQPGRGREAVLSYGLWQRLFQGDPKVLGRDVRIKGHPYRVVGIMPRTFAFPNHNDQMWLPLTIGPQDVVPSKAFDQFNFMLARLRPGTSIAEAHRQLRPVVPLIEKTLSASDQHYAADSGFDLSIKSYRQYLTGGQTEPLFLLQGAVLLILLMTCVNVANLLLSRILGRTHELAMRAALGATRWRLARQLLVEGLTLAVPGGAVGVVLGWWCLTLIHRSGFVSASSMFTISPDWRVAGFGVVLVAVTGILVSLLPILHLSRTDLQSLLQQGGKTTTGDRRSQVIKRGLVVVEVALATALVAGSGLLLHSFVKTQDVNPGFGVENVLTAGLLIPPNEHTGKGIANFDHDLVRDVRALPGVKRVGITNVLPFGGSRYIQSFKIRGHKLPLSVQSYTVNVDGGFFQALDIAPLRGRLFARRDAHSSRKVMIVNRLFVRKYFPHGDPIGKQIKTDGDWYTIIGVVPTIHNYSLTKAPHWPTMYLDAYQTPGRYMNLVIKTAVPPASVTQAVRNVVRRFDPAVPVFDVQPLKQNIADHLQQRKATIMLIMAFGGVALALVIVGVYGVMSYAVGQRVKECGIRLALGALPSDLLWLILKDGLKLLVIGLAVGIAGAVVLGYAMSSQLFGVAPFDPVTLAGSAVVLCAITLVACYLPARRASRLDPAIAIMEQ
jgi:putative ABC transport system permease protein